MELLQVETRLKGEIFPPSITKRERNRGAGFPGRGPSRPDPPRLWPVKDIIDVRPEETFDEEALASYLSEHWVEGSAPFRVRQFEGGRANLTYLLEFEDGREYVLRRPPLGPVAPGAHDMAREYTVLSNLWQAFPQAPRAHLFCDDSDVIGAPFFVMERGTGVVVRESVPEVFGGGTDPDQNRMLADTVVMTLAEFHRVDPADCGLEDLGRPEGFLRRQVTGWLQRWEAARHAPNQLADEVGGWLAATMPESPPPSLLHNDWRLDNMAVAADDPSVCTAVYDWDMATRGDPLCDLGTLFGSWHEPTEIDDRTHSLMPVQTRGWPTRRQAVDLYAAGSEVDTSRIDWYIVFGTWKLGVVLEQIYIRFLRGQTTDSRFESMGDGAAKLFELAADRRRLD